MVEELEELWTKLSFTEEEVEDVDARATIKRGKNCVVLKDLSHRSISLDTLRKNLRMTWKLNKGMQMSEIEEDLFLVEFGDGKDKKKVVDISP